MISWSEYFALTGRGRHLTAGSARTVANAPSAAVPNRSRARGVSRQRPSRIVPCAALPQGSDGRPDDGRTIFVASAAPSRNVPRVDFSRRRRRRPPDSPRRRRRPRKRASVHLPCLCGPRTGSTRVAIPPRACGFVLSKGGRSHDRLFYHTAGPAFLADDTTMTLLTVVRSREPLQGESAAPTTFC